MAGASGGGERGVGGVLLRCVGGTGHLWMSPWATRMLRPGGAFTRGPPRTLCGQPVPPGADGGGCCASGRENLCCSLPKQPSASVSPLCWREQVELPVCTLCSQLPPSPHTPGHTSSGHSPWNVQQPHGGPSDPPEALTARLWVTLPGFRSGLGHLSVGPRGASPPSDSQRSPWQRGAAGGPRRAAGGRCAAEPLPPAPRGAPRRPAPSPPAPLPRPPRRSVSLRARLPHAPLEPLPRTLGARRAPQSSSGAPRCPSARAPLGN